MRLCFDFCAILEGRSNVILAVDCDVIDHRQPVFLTELRQWFSVSQLLQIGLNLMLPGCALGNQVSDL